MLHCNDICHRLYVLDYTPWQQHFPYNPLPGGFDLAEAMNFLDENKFAPSKNDTLNTPTLELSLH